MQCAAHDTFVLTGPEKEKIDISPRVLRHRFLRKLAETKGVHHAREVSGHQSDRYI